MNGSLALKHSGRILIVDDTPANIRLLDRLLASKGYEVITAQDGASALNMTTTAPLPDLILLDIMMPDLDGYEVCEHLKADERTRSIPILFISALNDTGGIVKAFRMGGVDYITKPFQAEEVLVRVETHLTLVRQRQQIEALRERDRQHFEALDRLKNQFIHTVTHDLKNPLNVILCYAALLDETGEKTGFMQEALDAILSSVEKMRQLVTDMLDIAQIGTGVATTLDPVELSAFLKICLKGFPMLAEQKHIELVIVPPPEGVIVPMAASKMDRALANLVSNAIKYTPSGGRVEVTTQLEDKHVIIRVADTGLGIPAEDIPHLFEPFYRVKEAEHYRIEGTGLGLTVVQTVVEQHEGRVTVESELGRGSTFSIHLPLHQVETANLNP